MNVSGFGKVPGINSSCMFDFFYFVDVRSACFRDLPNNAHCTEANGVQLSNLSV